MQEEMEVPLYEKLLCFYMGNSNTNLSKNTPAANWLQATRLEKI